MPQHFTKNDNYVLFEHTGTLQPPGLTPETKVICHDFGGFRLAIADFSLADLSLVRLLDVDIAASCFKQLMPQFTRIAIVRKKDEFAGYFDHAMNLYAIQNIEADLFEGMDAAKAWLLSDQA